MSFDLGVWSAEARPSRAAAEETYRRLCGGETAVVPPSAAVRDFHAALIAEFPEPAYTADGSDAAGGSDGSDGWDESSPWSAGPDVGDGFVLMPMRWSRAAEVAPRVMALAAEHGLVCFDPQAEVVHVPPALRAAGALELRSCVGLPVSDPDPETVERAVRRLSADNWFVILEGPAGRFVQVGTGDQAGVAAGTHALEYRDGAPERHYRCVLPDRDQVISVFTDFLGDPSTRPTGVAWESLWL